MSKCILCTRPIPDSSPYDNYCSPICEKKGVGYGEEKGRKKGLGFFSSILILIAGTSFYGIKECNSEKKLITNDKEVIEIESQVVPEIQNVSNQKIEEKETSEQAIINNEGDVSTKSETISNDTLVTNNNSRMVDYINYQNKIKKANEMLKQGKSVSEIADSTSLTRSQIRQLRRKL